MKITQEKLNEIIESHGKWLRNEEGGKKAYLRGADLGGAYLGDADLRGADLGDAYLGDADFRGADLGGAYLRGANLRGADLGGADLRGANLRGAYLGGADLGGAYLGDADLNKTYYQITRIGSRNATTTYCVEDDNVVCGCWNNYRGGTLEEFKKRVESVYGKDVKTPDKKYYTQYMAAVEFFEKMVKLAKMGGKSKEEQQ